MVGLEKKTSHRQIILLNVLNPKDKAGNAEEEPRSAALHADALPLGPELIGELKTSGTW